MTYHFDYISKELKSLIYPATVVSHRFDAILSFRVFKNAFIAPYYEWNHSIGCIIDESGEAVKDSECIEWKENSNYYRLETAKQEQKKVIFLGFLLTGFGHSYTDNLRKLWFLETEEFKSLAEQGYELVYTTSLNRPIPQNTWEIFQLAGIDITQSRHITELTRFDEIIVPDNCLRAMDYGRVYCKEYLHMLNRIREHIPELENCPSKIYFTRTKFSANSKKEYGEKDIERVFRSKGYTILAPEEYPVLKQLQLVRGCDCFASTEGSVGHLSLFAKRNTAVTIVVKANYLNFHQVMINELADLDVTYIQAHHSSRANSSYPWWGPFYLCINHYLERYIGHPLLHLPFWLRFSYWEYSRNIPYRVYNRIRKYGRNIVNYLSQSSLFHKSAVL